MFLSDFKIDGTSFVNEIVAHDYRTADVFRKYDIDFCCGGKWPLETACAMRGLDTDAILKELKAATRNIHISNSLPFEEWKLDFLADYIINVHHRYLKKAIPEVRDYVDRFVESHKNKFPELVELSKIFSRMEKHMIPHMQQEEEIIFPYIKQIAYAYYNKESYAGLLVRTLRKPVEEMMRNEHDVTNEQIKRVRAITNHYTLPPKPCNMHKVTFYKMMEFDNDLVQHLHLENNILFPGAIQMEKELLQDDRP
ncbi:MAG: iron-sulfur cluster repair di-iron protein [Terrimonas sp.]|nr:iron-sulfur cluster repair di-iron protein [Terrimonas sp.]